MQNILNSKIKILKLKILWRGFLLLFSTFGFSQTLTTTTDSTQIKIGSQFHLTLKATVQPNDYVVFPDQKQIGPFEVLESYPIDTLVENQKTQLVKKYGLTQFDSGAYKIPSVPVIINSKKYFSDSIAILVNNVVVDTIKQQMFDIKPIATVDKPASNWWKYVLLAIFVLGSGFLVYFLILRHQKRKSEENPIYASPIEKALAHTASLEKKQLVEKGEIKTYYSELTDIARIYLEESIEVNAMESTSKELYETLKSEIKKQKISVGKTVIEHFYKVLQNADLVKFAKSKPLDFEIENDTKTIHGFLIQLDKAIPRSDEETETLFAEEMKQKKQRKQTTIRWVASIATVFVLAFLSLVYIVAEAGYDFYIGNSSKGLLQKEWIASEYGDPAIKIETPIALTRINEEAVQNNLSPNVKSVSKFTYGSIVDAFSVTLINTAFKDSIQLNSDVVLESDLKTLERLGAKNIFPKIEDFDNAKGFAGKRAIGTFTVENPVNKKNQKMAFEIVVFPQSTSAQELILIYKEEDKNAALIMDRIKNSIELKKENP